MRRVLMVPATQEQDEVIDYEPGRPESSAERLIGAILVQAMQDKMTRITLGLDDRGTSLFMRYGGLRGDDELKWWNMTPPPIIMFPHIMQALFAMTTFEPGVPMRGVLRINKDMCIHDIRVAIVSAYIVEFVWD